MQSMKQRKISSLTLIKHLCYNRSATETALLQRNDPLTFRWLERERKSKSRERSQLPCLDHFFPCSLSINKRLIVAFRIVSIFLLILISEKVQNAQISFIYRINSSSPSKTQEDWFDRETDENQLLQASSSVFVCQY